MSAALDRPFGVPRESLGQARVLRNKLAAGDTLATDAIGRISEPLQARTAKGSIPRPELMVEAARQWREQLAGPGRLSLAIDQTRSRLAIRELRLTAADFRLPNWASPEVEPGFAILVAELSVQRRNFHFESATLASLSLHAVARWYQRNLDITLNALAGDVASVAASVGTFEQAPDSAFSIPVTGGRWVGTVREVIDLVVDQNCLQKVLLIRSFLTD